MTTSEDTSERGVSNSTHIGCKRDGAGELTRIETMVCSALPSSSGEIGGDLGVSPSTVRDHVASIRAKGYPVEYDRSAGVYRLGPPAPQESETPEESEPVMGNEPPIRDIDTPDPRPTHLTTQSKRETTVEAKSLAEELEASIIERLEAKAPVKAPLTSTAGHEDMVLHITDVHMGDVVEGTETVELDNGRVVPVEVFNPSVTERSFEHITDKILELRSMFEGERAFDTLHVLYGGDFITNENVYDSQAHDIAIPISKQLSRSVAMATHQIKTFAEHFPSVQVICQAGNHGEIRSRGSSSKANFDRVGYLWLQDRIAETDIENVSMMVEGGQYYRNFSMRGGKMAGHLRHGHEAPKHIEATRMSESKWRGWQAAHRFDVAYLGHYHNARKAHVLHQQPVFMSPSMKPGSEFAERIGSPDCSDHRKMATVHGVSDDRPVTWECVIDDVDLDLDYAALTE